MLNRTVGCRVLALLLAGLLVGCGQMQPVGSRSQMIDYRVKDGDTLYSIAWRYGYNPRTVAGWNNIPPPYTIYPGQRLFIIPPYQQKPRSGAPPQQVARSGGGDAPAATVARTPPPSAATATTPARSMSNNTTAITQKKLENNPQRLHHGKISWIWPTEGNVATAFSPAKGKKGVDIGGKEGQSVNAAAAGTVVYSGNGLIGYGNLVIIKHSETYLSAYGHNKRLLVKEGSTVRQGEKIAEMGGRGKGDAVLHFEIRRDGKPVDPMNYLPKQGS